MEEFVDTYAIGRNDYAKRHDADFLVVPDNPNASFKEYLGELTV